MRRNSLPAFARNDILRYSSIIVTGIILTVYLLKMSLNESHYYKETRLMMGTTVEVTVPEKKHAEMVFKKLKELEDILSIWKPDSEVSRLNREGKLKVGKDMLAVVELAKKFYEITEGAFDITVHPLLDLWGFYKNERTSRIPSSQEIEAILPLVGSDKIIVDKENSVISFSKVGVKIDLGGIATGYAVDEAIKILKANGVRSALINVGGDIFCLGKKGNKPWRVGIRDPQNSSGVVKEIELEDKAVTTSGNYERFIEIDDKKYPHIIDPKTGFPVDKVIDSVTVIADNCVDADAMATALFVIGKEKANEIAKSANVTQFYLQ